MAGLIKRGVVKIEHLDVLGARSPIPDWLTGPAIVIGLIGGFASSWFVRDLAALGKLTDTYAPWVVVVAALALLDTAKDEFSGWGAGTTRMGVIALSMCAAAALVCLIVSVLVASPLMLLIGSLPGWLAFCAIAGLVVLAVMAFVSAPRRRREAARRDGRGAAERQAEEAERKRIVEDVLAELASRRHGGGECHQGRRSRDRLVAAGFGAAAGAAVAAGFALALSRSRWASAGWSRR